MAQIIPFAPSYTKGQTVSPAASAASIAIDAVAKSLCLTNLGSSICYIRVSNSATNFDATVNDYPIPAGAKVVISKPDGHNYLSYISASGTSLHIIPGEGF